MNLDYENTIVYESLRRKKGLDLFWWIRKWVRFTL